MISENAAEHLLALDPQDLILLLSPDEEAARNLVGGDLYEACRAYAIRQIDRYRAAICGNPTVRAYCQDPSKYRKVQIVCGIAGLMGFGGAPALAALMVQEGVDNLCKGDWSLPQDHLSQPNSDQPR